MKSQFCTFQLEDLSEEIEKEERIYVQWIMVGKMRAAGGNLKYDKVAEVMLCILTIPHSNLEIESIFSQVTEKPEHSSDHLGVTTLEKLLTLKLAQQGSVLNR